MQYRNFPGNDVQVNEAGFGTWTVATGWRGEKTDEDVVQMSRVTA